MRLLITFKKKKKNRKSKHIRYSLPSLVLLEVVSGRKHCGYSRGFFALFLFNVDCCHDETPLSLLNTTDLVSVQGELT